MATSEPVLIEFSFTVIELISLILGVASVVLGIFAIWLSLHLKNQSDKVNEETRQLLVDIKVDAKSVTQGVMSEMEKWGDVGRGMLTSGSTPQEGGVSGQSAGTSGGTGNGQ
ncbi:hypothetical protein ACWLRU_003049 [Vibrio parahaemolyticus]|nr:hypothetical protein [Vibrio parahaemolyticus]EIV8660728.1 hypothetical protein [Vibrio parahaemolyticus]